MAQTEKTSTTPKKKKIILNLPGNRCNKSHIAWSAEFAPCIVLFNSLVHLGTDVCDHLAGLLVDVQAGV
jgi:hypothetical protein